MKLQTLISVFGIYLILCPGLDAQLQPHSRYEGVMYPVIDCDEKILVVSTDKGKRRTTYSDVEIRQADSFGDGFVNISNITFDLDPLQDASTSEKRKIKAMRFEYAADVVSDQNLKNCYVVLSYVSNGSLGTHFQKVGSLTKGRVRTIKIENKATVDRVGNLHIFSETLEIRSNQISQPYTLNEYSKQLIADVRGVSAVALVESERNYAHVLSSSGNLLATYRDRETHYSLLVYDVENLAMICEADMGEFDEGIWDPTWINDSTIAFKHAGDLYLIDIHDGKPEKIKDDVPQILGQIKDSPHILTLVRYEEGQGSFKTTYDVLKREVVDLEEFRSGTNYLDYQGIPRVRARYLNDKFIWFVKPQADSDWVELDKHSKLENVSFTVTGDQALDQDVKFHSIGRDGDTAYVSTRHASDTFKLAEFSLSEGTIKRTIAGHSRYDMSRGDDGHSNFLFNDSTGQLIGISYETDKTRISWLDPEYKEIQASIDGRFPGNVNIPIDWSEDLSSFIYFSYSEKDPGIYYLLRPFEGKLIPLIDFGKELEGFELGSTKPIQFEARDGATVYGYITLPPGYDGESPLPTVVDIHGGPTSRDSWEYDSTNQFFATRGYAVINVNFRGSSGYGKAYQEKGLFSRLDTVIIDDVADAVKYAINQGWSDAEKVGVTGASFGGWATYLCVIKYPDLFRAGVPIAAVSSWRHYINDDRWSAKYSYRYWRSIVDANDFDEDQAFIEPLKRVEEITRPLYIMHGYIDSNVIVEQAEMMVKALEKHDKEFQVMYFPLATHTYWPDSSRITILNETENFFKKHLGLD